MIKIDYASIPPTATLGRNPSRHMANYEKVFAASLARAEDKAATEVGNEADDLAEYLRTYDELGIDRVVIRARDVETTFGIKVANETVAEFCHAHAPRFIGLASVDPHKGIAALREFEHAILHLGLRGLHLPCFEHKLAVNAKELYPLYAKCIELDVPVNVHVGMSFSSAVPMTYGLPRYLDEVMVHFPELKVVASVPAFPWILELIGVAWRHPNVHIALNAMRPKYLQTAGSGFEPLLQYGRTILKDRIICGSNWPLQPVRKYFDELEALPLEEGVLAGWVGGNAARLFKMDSTDIAEPTLQTTGAHK
ncbi:amidohydrolase family protein [Pusillimonas sp. ANT_WB101]|uniref:amidohydrolase family protein n=1 Tax=Pusillimonas sp. ANT_WB101 TaxID=2597356 RepID=UPI0011EDB26B|nr:amidohydrolase family protein [Pusillimonas sp. ANT_WB101]KAA0892687.1 amidohydrolase [Pusillimonas sp. ANT_WB101]